MKKRRDQRVAVRLNLEERAALDRLATKRDMPASMVIREALKQALTQGNEAAR